MASTVQRPQGLPDSHPWLMTRRWGKTWRVWCMLFACTAVGFALASFTLPGLDLLVPTGLGPGLYLLLALPTLGAVVTICLGTWLQKWTPFTQGLVFGAATVLSTGITMLIIELIDVLFSGACRASGDCGALVSDAFFIMLLFALPCMIFGTVAYQLAIASVAPRRGRLVWSVMTVAVVLALLLWVIRPVLFS